MEEEGWMETGEGWMERDGWKGMDEEGWMKRDG